MADPSTATITVWPNHRVTVEPFVPELGDVLARLVTGFRAGGPLGHTMASGVELPHAGRVRHRVRDAGGGYRTLDGTHARWGGFRWFEPVCGNSTMSSTPWTAVATLRGG